jgi:RecA-family ATPase
VRLQKIGAKYVIEIPVTNDLTLKIEFKGVRFSGYDNVRALIHIIVPNMPQPNDYAAPVVITQPHRIKEFARAASDILKINEESLFKVISVASYQLISDLYSVPEPSRLEIKERVKSNFLIEGFVLENLLTVLFARGGAGKSFLSLLSAIAVQNADKLPEGFPLNPLKQGNTLYLDWESDKEDMDRRFTRIVRGMRLGDIIPPMYISVVRPLSDIIDDILTTCVTHDIKFVIIDSVGLASGGSIEDASTSISFFRAVRELTDAGVSVLALTHMSKSALKDDLKTPIGSVYYENMPRLIWQMKSDMAEDVIRTQLLLRKTNVGKIPNFGFTMRFGLDTVVIARDNHIDLEVEDDEQTNFEIMLDTLRRAPQGLTMSDLAQESGLRKDQLRNLLLKAKRQNKVIAVGKKWQYIEEPEYDEPPF